MNPTVRRALPLLGLPVLALLALLALLARGAAAGEAPTLEEGVRALLAETDPVARTERLVALVGGKPEPSAVAAALAAGWSWPADAAKGRISWVRRTLAGDSTVFAHVPKGYDPKQAWPVLVWLHGGVSRPADGAGVSGVEGLADTAEGLGFLLLSPSGRLGAEWWSPPGVALVRGGLADLARRYRVDPDRVYVAGHSDGGSGCFHLLLHDPDPYAAFVSVMGNPLVTRLAGGPVFAANLASRPVYAINGGQDRLYPSAEMKPVMEELRSAGCDLTWVDLPDFGHDGRAFFEKGEEIRAFWAAHPRRALPERVAFETSVPEREGRRAWVEILEVDPAAPSAADFAGTALPELQATPRPRLGVQIDQDHEGEGVRIEAVEEGSPAAQAGFREGDVLVKAGDVPILGPGDLLRLRDYLVSLGGGPGVFTVRRDGQEVVLEATPKAMFDRPEPPADRGYGRPSGRVEAVKKGPGVIEVRTRGVAALRLHLAPPIWSPGERLTVVLNGKPAFEGVPESDVTAMLAGAVRGGPLAPVSYATLRLAP